MKTAIVFALLFVCTAAAAGPANPCDAAKASLQAATEAVEARKQAVAALQECDDSITTYRAELARERRNPSGVVDLRRLHEYGELLQGALEARPYLIKNKTAADVAVQQRLVAAKRNVNLCKEISQ